MSAFEADDIDAEQQELGYLTDDPRLGIPSAAPVRSCHWQLCPKASRSDGPRRHKNEQPFSDSALKGEIGSEAHFLPANRAHRFRRLAKGEAENSVGFQPLLRRTNGLCCHGPELTRATSRGNVGAIRAIHKII